MTKADTLVEYHQRLNGWIPVRGTEEKAPGTNKTHLTAITTLQTIRAAVLSKTATLPILGRIPNSLSEVGSLMGKE